MQTWAKRGLQTALVTGGLLMLGTGIASADEDVNPDKPASPLAGSVTAPVHMDKNEVGSPLGSHPLPKLHKDAVVRTSDLTGTVPTGKLAPSVDPLVDQAKQAAAGTAAPGVDKVRAAVPSHTEGARDQVAPLTAKTQPLTEPVTNGLSGLPGADKLAHVPSLDKVNVPAVDARHAEPVEGNQINVDLVAPIDISGNAIAILGEAHATNDSWHSYGQDRDVAATGAGGVISGNVIDADLAVPVQVANNAVAILGTATACGTSWQEAWATGDIVTDGSNSVLGGNVVAPQVATPVQADGNAVSVLGLADATSQADTSADAGGYILTSGQDSVLGGNAVPVPVASPVKANGNAIMVAGRSVAVSDATADATAGATRVGMYGVPTYVETSGNPGVLAGNIVDPSVSGPVSLCGNATGAAGGADATCDTATDAIAGGTNRSTGEGSVLSGAIVPVPVALPVSGFGNAVPVVGRATADASNTTDSTSGGDSYTRGHESILSGTTAVVSDASPVDLFANSVAAVGDADATAENTANNTSGGNTGTTGDDSLGGGTMGTIPAALPGEIIGNTGAVAGTADSTGSEVKTTTSGGGSNTADDNGVLASNLVNTPVASAAQLFGNSVGVLGVTDTNAKAVNEVTAGGPSKATGTAGTGSGNIVQAPVSEPVQAFGTGASVLAKGTQCAVNDLDSEAGGDAMSDGVDAIAGGNVVSVPGAGAGQVFGESVAVLGKNDALAGSITESEAGGDTQTNGESGVISGNVLSPQALPVVQTFAAVVSGVGGINSSTATNETDAESGGDIDTSGDSGFISGNLVDVPAAAVAQPFGDAVAAVASKSYASGLSDTEGEAGGTSTTSGNGLSSLSGIDATLPVGANVPVYDVPVEVLAQAMTESANNSDLQVGEGEPQVNLPIGGGLAPTEVPSLLQERTMPTDPTQGVFSGVLTGLTNGFQVPVMPVGRTGSVDPVTDLLGDVFGSQIPVLETRVGDGLPLMAGHLPVGQLPVGQLPVGQLPAGQLPVGHLPVGQLPVGQLPVGQLPVGGQRELPQTPAVPDLGRMLSPLSAIDLDQFGGFGGARTESPLEYTPLSGDLTDVTTVLPVIPAAPVDTDLPVTQGITQQADGSSLDSTRAALANLFTTHPIV
jgi:trimeric autotransporter adhesin